MDFAGGDECVDARPPGVSQRAGRSLDIHRVSPRKRRHLNPGELTAHCVHGFEIALGGDREPGFEDIDAQFHQFSRHPQLLGYGHAAAGRLFTVPEGGVEDVNAIRHESS